MSTKRPWTAADEELLKESAGRLTAREIGQQLSRPEGAVRQKAYAMDISLAVRADRRADRLGLRTDRRTDVKKEIPFKLTAVVPGNVVSTVMSLISDEGGRVLGCQAMVNGEDMTETVSPSPHRYVGGIRNKGISAADYILNMMATYPGREWSLDSVSKRMTLANPPFAAHTASSSISKLVSVGKVLRVRKGCYMLSRGQGK